MATGPSSRALRLWRAVKQLFAGERLPLPPPAPRPHGTMLTLWRLLTEREELPASGERGPPRPTSLLRWLLSPESLPDDGAHAAPSPRATEDAHHGRR